MHFYWLINKIIHHHHPLYQRCSSSKLLITSIILGWCFLKKEFSFRFIHAALLPPFFLFFGYDRRRRRSLLEYDAMTHFLHVPPTFSATFLPTESTVCVGSRGRQKLFRRRKEKERNARGSVDGLGDAPPKIVSRPNSPTLLCFFLFFYVSSAFLFVPLPKGNCSTRVSRVSPCLCLSRVH